MSKNQSEDRPKNTKGKFKKTSGKGRTVLGDINDDSEKQDGKERTKSGEDSNRNAKKHGGKHRTVLGEINDDN